MVIFGGRTRHKAGVVRSAAGLVAALVLSGCASAQQGSAMRAGQSGSVTTVPGLSTSALTSSLSAAGTPPPAAGDSTSRTPPFDAYSGTLAAGSPASRTSPVDGSDAPRAPESGWSAVVETGTAAGIPSPTGDLSALLTGSSVCFVPLTGSRRCGEFASSGAPLFVVFAPDAEHLLMVTGPADAASVYLFDPADASARVLEPGGVTDMQSGSPPYAWNLSSVAWSIDGQSVLMVPKTSEITGAVLQFGLDGRTSERARLPAELANSSPSMWTTTTGMAVIANSREQSDTLWWLDFASGTLSRLVISDRAVGHSLVLSGADPLGRSVLVCQRTPNGGLAPTVDVAVNGAGSAVILRDSVSCAGSVFSPDGQYLAMTSQTERGYELVVIDVAASRRVLTVPLPVPAPSIPPYLTWYHDVVVAADVSGEWPMPSLNMRLRR